MAPANTSVVDSDPIARRSARPLVWPLLKPSAQKECILRNEVLALHWEESSAEALFQACADRSDPRAWEEFVRRYGALLERTAYRFAQMRGNPGRELLNDLVQECYLRLCADNSRALRVFRPTRPDSEFGYLKVIATHAAVDFFRRRTRDRFNISLDKTSEPEDNTDLDREILLQEVEACLLRITEGPARDRDRVVFRLYYVQGLTAKAISQIPSLGLRGDGVESLLGRLRQALRHCLRLQGGLSKEKQHERLPSP
jgi:RNA polymerase sigma-70 factor, ECF subfamily